MKKQRIQEWKVPATGTYTFKLAGSSTSIKENTSQVYKGKGSEITGKNNLEQDDILYIIVGQSGTWGPSGWNSGGGGGTFVILSNPYKLLFAAGGRNVYTNSKGNDGSLTNDGENGTGVNAGIGGSGAKNGENGTGGDGGFGKSNAIYIGGSCLNSNGGFGGGGGGGGGGYSGGGGGMYTPTNPTGIGSGGGGGSYSINGESDTVVANNIGDGYVTITLT
jgi:tripartite motif-containing protein 56